MQSLPICGWSRHYSTSRVHITAVIIGAIADFTKTASTTTTTTTTTKTTTSAAPQPQPRINSNDMNDNAQAYKQISIYNITDQPELRPSAAATTTKNGYGLGILLKCLSVARPLGWSVGRSVGGFDILLPFCRRAWLLAPAWVTVGDSKKAFLIALLFRGVSVSVRCQRRTRLYRLIRLRNEESMTR